MTTAEALDRYLMLLARRDRRAAIAHAVALVEGGMPLAEFVLGVLAPAQAEVGRRWERGEILPAEERLATDVADTVLAVAAARTTLRDDRGRLVLCVAEREHHNLPARMIAELLRAEGFAVMFLGAPRAERGAPAFLTRLEADALLVSCSLAMNLPGVLPLIAAAHEIGLPVIAGGHGFGPDDRRARRLGADAWGRRMEDVAPALAGFAERPGVLAAPTADVATHGELVAIRRPLVAELADRVEYRYGRLLARHLRAPRRLREDLRNLLLFLEAAVLCDERILVDYAGWLREHTVAAGAHPDLVPAVLSTLAARLGVDSPPAALPLQAALASVAEARAA